jgi:uncharacterized membrane protein
MMQKTTPLLFAAALQFSSPAFAYMGPGPTAGAIALVLGVLATIFFAFAAVLWYPVKRLLKQWKKPTPKKPPPQPETK